MMRKLLATLLALALLVGSLSTLADPSSLPKFFVPDRLYTYFNMSYVAVNVVYEEAYGNELDSAQQAEKAALIDRMTLSNTETIGDTVYYRNEDGSIELTASYGGRGVDPNAPADRLSLTISDSTWASDAKKMNLMMLMISRSMLCIVIAQYDHSTSVDKLNTWMTNATETGDSLTLDGYDIMLVHEDDRFQYILMPTNGADATQDAPQDAATPPEEDDRYLFSWGGFTVELLRIEPVAYSSGDVYLKFFSRFVNHSDYPLFLSVQDAMVNGVRVEGTGKTDLYRGIDTGPDSEACLMVNPARDNFEAGTQAICNPQEVTMTLQLIETEHYKMLCSKQITLPLSDIPRFTPKPTIEPTPTPVPASYYYDTLARGDRGDGVAQMQMELIDLGYLTGKADGVFGAQTAEAVRLFSEANGLGSSEIATPEMQQKLFGYGAKAYEEPWIPLVFSSDATCSWNVESGDRFSVHVEVTNTSRTRTIKAFELYAYAEDIYGNRVYGDTTYYGTTNRTVKPGKKVYSDYLVLPNYSQVYTIHFAIKQVVFDDGTVHESDDPGYWYWELYR